MAEKQHTLTYDYACFHVLCYEYGDNKIKDSEKKIKAKLKYHQLGVYDEQRINMLRTLKEEVAKEIGLYRKSAYYNMPHGEYCNIEDFDYKRLAKDLALNYPLIDKKDVDAIVGAAIDFYHLR